MNRIKQLRSEKGIKQETLANLLGMETAGISKIETGRVPLKEEYILKLANYFNVSTDYLLGNSDMRNISDSNEIYITYEDYKNFEDLDGDDKELIINMIKSLKKKK